MFLEDRIQSDFENYSEYVNYERAIAHLFDGQKPVARRILYTMYKMKLKQNSQPKKSSNIVGQTMALHPHGDMGIYNALVRMTQSFSNKVPLIIGRGNFGSLDHSAAASRYTEARLSEAGELLVNLLDKKITPMVPNFDSTETEPEYLPATFPALLVNGSSGIGVGMAANIPSHNISEVIDAAIHLLYNENASSEELLQFIQGPDFNCGCDIVNKNSFASIYGNGKGSFRLRAKFNFTGNQLVITNFPYKTPASKIEEQILESIDFPEIIKVINTTAQEEELEITLKQNTDHKEIIRKFCALTDCEKTFSMELRAMVDKPKIYSLKDFLYTWVMMYKDIVRTDLEKEVSKIDLRLEIINGLLRAIKNIDSIIELIKNSEHRGEAKQRLIDINFTESQANAILDIKLSRLTRLDGIALKDEQERLTFSLNDLQEILKEKSKFLIYVRTLLKANKKLDGERKSKITNAEFPKVIKIKSDKFYLSNLGTHIKIHEELPKGKYLIGDSKHPIYILHDNYVVPIKNAKETIYTNTHLIIEGDNDIFHISKDGYIKRTEVSELLTNRKALVTKQDVFTAVQASEGFILITTKSGQQVQFNLDEVNPTKKGAQGVIAVKLNGEQIDKIEVLAAPKKGVKTKRAHKF